MSAQTAGPDFEGVLGAHVWTGSGKCACAWSASIAGRLTIQGQHRAHVAAELRAEVGRWLGSDDALYVAAHRESDGLMSALAALAECVGVEEVGACESSTCPPSG